MKFLLFSTLFAVFVSIAVAQFLGNFGVNLGIPSLGGSVNVRTPTVTTNVGGQGGLGLIGAGISVALETAHVAFKAAIIAGCAAFQGAVQIALNTVMTVATSVLCPGGSGRGIPTSSSISFRVVKRQIFASSLTCTAIDVVQNLVNAIIIILKDAHDVIEKGVDSAFAAAKIAVQTAGCNDVTVITSKLSADIDSTMASFQHIYKTGIDEVVTKAYILAGPDAANTFATFISPLKLALDTATGTLLVAVKVAVGVALQTIQTAAGLACSIPFVNQILG